MAGVQEDMLSSGNGGVRYPSSSSSLANGGQNTLVNPMNVLNMAEDIPTARMAANLVDMSNHQLPSIPLGPNYHNMASKMHPATPIQSHATIQQYTLADSNSTGITNGAYRPLPQQQHLQGHHLASQFSSQPHPPPQSPILHSSATVPPSTPFSMTTPMHPPTQPTISLQNVPRTNGTSNKSFKFHDKSVSGSQGGGASASGGGVSANKPRKPCNCKNSQCLKLYCDCFANGEFCRESCNCQNCKNSRSYEDDRTKAVKACLERNPNAFKPKVGHAHVGDGRRHIKGCNCKKSGCLKNYCECYEAKIPCSYLCRCIGCQNVSDRPEGKGLMELANAADLRTQQQRAATSHFLEQMETPMQTQMPPSDSQKLPYSFVNKDIAKATAVCLLEEASHATSSGQNPVEVERAVLMEFGRCLEQIISSSESANNMRESVTGLV